MWICHCRHLLHHLLFLFHLQRTNHRVWGEVVRMFSGHWMVTIDTALITCHQRHLPRQHPVFPPLPLLCLQTPLQLFLLHHPCCCHQQRSCWKEPIKSPICPGSLTVFEWKKSPCNETSSPTSLLDPNYWTNFPHLDCHRVKVTKSPLT